MSSSILIPFTTPANYTLSDASKIEIADGKAKLILQTDNVDFTEDFADDTDFTYDSAKAEFTGGKVQQKDQRPSNSMFHASYTSSLNGNWGNGTLTPKTSSGSLSMSGGDLVLGTENLKYIEYYGAANAEIVQTGTVIIEVIPKYSGNPASNQSFFYLAKDDGSFVSRAELLHHSATGNIYIYIFDSAGVAIINGPIGVWNPTAGTRYVLRLNVDVTTGATKLFINDVQFGATQTATGTRSNSIGRFTIGSNFARTNLSNFDIGYVAVFSDIKTSTPGLSETIYATTNVILPEMEHTYVGAIIAGNTFVPTESGTPKYSIQVGRSGDYLYWTGAAWAVSDGSYAQANTAATFNTNFPTLDVDGEKYGQVKIHFNESNSQSDVSNLVINMNVDTLYPTTNPYADWNSSVTSSELTDFIETATKTGSDEIKYAIKIDGNLKYYNAGLQTSNGTYAQANTAAEILANIGAFLTTRSTVSIRIFLHSDDGYTKPDCDSILIYYNAAIPDPVPSTLVNLEGYIYSGNAPASGLKIYMRPHETGFFTGDVFQNYVWTEMATTNSVGWFEINQYLQPTGEYWEIKIGAKRYKIELLNQAEMSLEDAPTLEVITV